MLVSSEIIPLGRIDLSTIECKPFVILHDYHAQLIIWDISIKVKFLAKSGNDNNVSLLITASISLKTFALHLPIQIWSRQTPLQIKSLKYVRSSYPLSWCLAFGAVNCEIASSTYLGWGGILIQLTSTQGSLSLVRWIQIYMHWLENQPSGDVPWQVQPCTCGLLEKN